MSDIIKVGEQVPDLEIDVFQPADGAFGKVSLSDYQKKKKWVVLFFYPGDYTFVCPTELADVSRHYKELAKAGVEVISMSADTKYVHLAWQREEKLLKDIQYPMGSDTTGKIARLFGVYDEESGMPLRGTFFISPDGKLTMAEVNYYNVGRSADELLRKLKAEVYLRVHPNEACPANWSEGMKTLKPGSELVGRVQEALS